MCTGMIGAGALGDPALDGRRVHRQRRRIGVGEDRQGLVDQDGVVAGDEGERRDDDLVAGVDVEDVHAHDRGPWCRWRSPGSAWRRAVSRRRLRTRGTCSPGAAVPLAAAQHLEDGRFPGLAPLRPPGPASLVHRRASEQGREVGGGSTEAPFGNRLAPATVAAARPRNSRRLFWMLMVVRSMPRSRPSGREADVQQAEGGNRRSGSRRATSGCEEWAGPRGHHRQPPEAGRREPPCACRSPPGPRSAGRFSC